MLETLLFSVDHSIATITFNRPSAMNSFDRKMADELLDVAESVRRDASVRAVLLNGAGPLFMPGGDIRFFYDQLKTMPAGVMAMVRTLNASVMNLMQMSKPVLASVHGSVAGAGMSLMMACDLIIAADNTKFTLAYSGIGITPDGGATFNLPRLVGTKKAMEWILLSDIFDAQMAYNNGLINWAVKAEKLGEETQRILKRLATGPTLAYGHAKRLINESWHYNIETQLEHEARAFEACSMTSDFKKGVSEFLQKHKPEFSGK